MLKRYNELRNCVLHADDGEIGRCKDFLYDDRDWQIRYMVADTKKWLPGRKVILTTDLLKQPRWDDKSLPVGLTREQFQRQPPLEEDPPLIQQIAQRNWIENTKPFYWVGPGGFGVYEYPWPPVEREQKPLPPPDPEQAHLRSAEELTGYNIEAEDGRIGHVDDLLVQVEPWTVRFFIVDTRNWLPGRKVLVSPQWAVNVDWRDRSLVVALSKEAIEKSPEYDPDKDLSRLEEAAIFNFYGLTPYWKDERNGG
jgi:hypothetical protein